MKLIAKSLPLVAAAACLSACTDLDTEVDTKYTKVPDNPIIVQSEFEGCYYYTRQESMFGRNFWEGIALMGDEVMGCCYTTAGYYDNGRYLRCSIHDPKADTPGIGEMGDLMSGITYTNERIRNFGGEEGKDPIVAPLRAIRAYYTFWMMDLYGDCPIIERPLAEGEILYRQPRAAVAQWIEGELLEILNQEEGLSAENNAATYGRPNRWMAEALLVKLYLNWGVYTNDINTVSAATPNEKLADCVKYCDDIINSGLFSVGKGYRQKFFPDNGVHIKDFIYAVPFDPETLWVSDDWRRYSAGHETARWFGFKKETLCQPYTWGWKPESSLAGTFVLTPECVDRFNLPGDERNIMVLVGPQTTFDANYNKTDEPIYVYKTATFKKKHGALDYKKDFEWGNPGISDAERNAERDILSLGEESNLDNLMKGARLAKYPPREIDYSKWSRMQANDIPMFRLADVLLTKAECIVRGASATNGDTPASLINQVRDCASAPHISGAVTLQDIMDERGRELIWEPWRRNDLIRCGMFENDWGVKNLANPAAKTDTWRRLCPIPKGVMDTNTNWAQNPGY